MPQINLDRVRVIGLRFYAALSGSARDIPGWFTCTDHLLNQTTFLLSPGSSCFQHNQIRRIGACTIQWYLNGIFCKGVVLVCNIEMIYM